LTLDIYEKFNREKDIERMKAHLRDLKFNYYNYMADHRDIVFIGHRQELTISSVTTIIGRSSLSSSSVFRTGSPNRVALSS
jgi:hypothetical protein